MSRRWRSTRHCDCWTLRPRDRHRQVSGGHRSALDANVTGDHAAGQSPPYGQQPPPYGQQPPYGPPPARTHHRPARTRRPRRRLTPSSRPAIFPATEVELQENRLHRPGSHCGADRARRRWRGRALLRRRPGHRHRDRRRDGRLPFGDPRRHPSADRQDHRLRRTARRGGVRGAADAWGRLSRPGGHRHVRRQVQPGACELFALVDDRRQCPALRAVPHSRNVGTGRQGCDLRRDARPPRAGSIRG